MMRKSNLQIDESLIISRLERRELLDISDRSRLDAKFFPKITKADLTPFLNTTPCNLNLSLTLLGSNILNIKFARGIFCHGLTDLLSDLIFDDGLFAISRLNLASPIFYQLSFVLAFESLTGIERNAHQSLHYALAAEFGRIFHHLNVVKNMSLCLQLSTAQGLAENLMLILQKPIATLKRIQCEGQEISQPCSFFEIHDALFEGRMLAENLANTLGHEAALIKGLTHKALVTVAMASSMGLSGPYLRANRIHYDLRQTEPLKDLYKTAPLLSLTDGGDARARFFLRMLEIIESLKWLKEAIHRFEKNASQLGPIIVPKHYADQKPKKPFAFGEIEAPEGDMKIGIFTTKNLKRPYQFRVRSPAYFIAQSMPYLFSDLPLNELPLMLYSLGIIAEEIDQ